MTPEKLTEVLKRYAAYLTETRIEGLDPGIPGRVRPLQLPDDEYDSKVLGEYHVLCHLTWMCEEAVRFADFNKPADLEISDLLKAHRWLGYIQGELRALGRFSITELRDHSRSAEPTTPSLVDLGLLVESLNQVPGVTVNHFVRAPCSLRGSQLIVHFRATGEAILRVARATRKANAILTVYENDGLSYCINTQEHLFEDMSSTEILRQALNEP